MESDIIETGANEMCIFLNQYSAGDSATVYYRTAAVLGDMSGASWTVYNGTSFTSLGYAQVKVEN